MKNDNLPKKKAQRTEIRRICASMLQRKKEPVITDGIEKSGYERQQFTNDRTFFF